MLSTLTAHISLEMMVWIRSGSHFSYILAWGRITVQNRGTWSLTGSPKAPLSEWRCAMPVSETMNACPALTLSLSSDYFQVYFTQQWQAEQFLVCFAGFGDWATPKRG